MAKSINAINLINHPYITIQNPTLVSPSQLLRGLCQGKVLFASSCRCFLTLSITKYLFKRRSASASLLDVGWSLMRYGFPDEWDEVGPGLFSCERLWEVRKGHRPKSVAFDGIRQKCFNWNICGISVTIFSPWILSTLGKKTVKWGTVLLLTTIESPQISKISSTQHEKNAIPVLEYPNTEAEIIHWTNLHCFIPMEEFAILFRVVKLLCSDILESFNITCINQLWAHREDGKELGSTAWEVQLQLWECWICWNSFTDPSAHTQRVRSSHQHTAAADGLCHQKNMSWKNSFGQGVSCTTSLCWNAVSPSCPHPSLVLS